MCAMLPANSSSGYHARSVFVFMSNNVATENPRVKHNSYFYFQLTCSPFNAYSCPMKNGPYYSHGVELLRRAMRANGWTQDEVARAIGVAPPTICNILSGKRGVGLGIALKLQDTAGINPAHWLRGPEAS